MMSPTMEGGIFSLILLSWMPTSASTYISLRGKALILLIAHIFPHLLFYTFFLKDKQYSAMFVKGRRLMGISHLHASNVPRLGVWEESTNEEKRGSLMMVPGRLVQLLWP